MTPENRPARKPTVFVGCAGGNLSLAYALQDYLDEAFLITVWDQRTVRSNRILQQELVRNAEKSDFAIFIVGLDAPAGASADHPYFLNQNVLYEIGLFSGAIGSENVFLVVPRNFKQSLAIPTDLEGVTFVRYNNSRFQEDGNSKAAMAGAADEIRTTIFGQLETGRKDHRVTVRSFPLLVDEFNSLIRKSQDISLCFIHSRRWRENHGDLILERLRKGNLRLTMYVPDIGDASVVKSLGQRFDDGRSLPGMLTDLIRWVTLLLETSTDVSIFVYKRMPAFSFYIFDELAFVPLYPNAKVRQPSPTFIIPKETFAWDFVVSDKQNFEKECSLVDSGYLIRADDALDGLRG